MNNELIDREFKKHSVEELEWCWPRVKLIKRTYSERLFHYGETGKILGCMSVI